LTIGPSRPIFPPLADLDVIAHELSGLGNKVRDLERRLAEAERVNARLEDAALSTSRALREISLHWDAVHEAMRRAGPVSEDSDHEAERTR
jgi:hypothetical protein